MQPECDLVGDDRFIRMPDGKRYRYTEIRHQSDLLATYHGAAERPQCYCRGESEEPLPLVIRRLENRYSLAAYPKTVHVHRETICPIYQERDPDVENALSTFSSAAIEKNGDRFRVFLDSTLKATDPDKTSPIAPTAENTNRQPGEKRNRITLLGLLEFLWEGAELNVIDASDGPPSLKGHRFTLLSNRLLKMAAHVDLGVGSLESHLWTPVRDNFGGNAAAHLLQWAKSLERDHYWYFIGRIGREWTLQEPDGQKYWQLLLVGCNGIELLASDKLKCAACNSYTTPNPTDKRHYWAIAKCQPPRAFGRGRAVFNAVEIAWLRTNSFGIPGDSEFELQVADALCSAGRSFSKPLRFAPSAHTAEEKWASSHPDFLLDGKIPMEVWGREDPAYLRNIPDRLKRYETSGRGRIWEWHAYRKDRMPSFCGW